MGGAGDTAVLNPSELNAGWSGQQGVQSGI